MKFFEDIAIGDRRELGHYTFGAEDIKQFAARYDPQPFHTDEAVAARSHFGGLVASGWHTASIFMKLQAREIAARGAEPERTGISPGFRELRWPKPVFAGDTLTYTTEVIRKRELASRPEWGIVFSHITAVNQRGELVLEFEGCVFIGRRGT
ncbi:MAG: MaoC family dehydratase [Xanthobacteraceae bacterium]